MVLLLIRHGHTDAIASYLAGRSPGVSLNEKGRAQARALADALGGLPFVTVCSSPLDRTLQTAGPLAAARGLEIDVRPGLAEVDFGEWTGRTFVDLETDPRWRTYNADREHAVIPGGESLRDVQRRALDELARVRADYPSGLVAAFSHAEVIRSVIGALRGLTLDEAMQVKVAPARVTLLRGVDLQVSEQEMNLQPADVVRCLSA